MTPDETTATVSGNKAKVLHYFEEVVGRTDIATTVRAIEEMMTPSFIDHDGPDPYNGREALKEVVSTLMKAMSGFHIRIELIIGERDYIAVRWRGEATHTEEVNGIHPTGRRITWTENEIYRFRDGRIAESWGEGTFSAALAEIGLAFSSNKSGAGGRIRKS
ncbi:MAG TPA: ester cyclase [Acidimicrobiales bacterium]|nr:ester cyclase [Acidimicrobiales bacterium]